MLMTKADLVTGCSTGLRLRRRKALRPRRMERAAVGVAKRPFDVDAAVARRRDVPPAVHRALDGWQERGRRM